MKTTTSLVRLVSPTGSRIELQAPTGRHRKPGAANRARHAFDGSPGKGRHRRPEPPARPYDGSSRVTENAG
jgi:hypothetical protein